MELAAALARSTMTVKRSLNELEDAGPVSYTHLIQERLWELRKDKGLNLEELSKLTGISKSALASYWCGIKKVDSLFSRIS